MKLWVAVFMLAGVLGSGCGRSDTIYSDDADHLVVIEHSGLPTPFFDQSANRADAMVANGALRLRLRGGESAAGSFTDASLKGSRAIVGISGYETSKLSDFDLRVDSVSSTTASVRVSLIVDLKCDDTRLRTIESSVAVGSSDVNSAWTTAGEPITDSSNSSVVLSSTPSSLSALLGEYPDACLKNGVSDAPDAPASIPLAAVQLSIGSGTSTSVGEVSISSLELNGDTYSSWSLQ